LFFIVSHFFKKGSKTEKFLKIFLHIITQTIQIQTINFHLPIPGSTISSDTTVKSNNNNPYSSSHLIKFHIPMPGSTTSSDTTVPSNSSLHHVNHLLTELQSGFYPRPTVAVQPNIHPPLSIEDNIF